ncbi:MAG: hypothetical protein ACJ79S_00555 [Gemmatimonadaceae bacterium]
MIQTLIVIAIVAAAALYVGRRAWRTLAAARTRKGAAAGGCDAGCGCEGATAKGKHGAR